MKRILWFLLLSGLLFALFACGGGAEPGGEKEPSEDEVIEEEEEKGEEEEGIINLLNDYKLVYDQYVLGMEDLAEAFAEKVSDECDTELSILEYAKAKKEKYRIYIGKISNDGTSNREAKRLTDLTAKISSAYSVKFSDETLMITGTSIAEVEKAIEYLYEFIEDGEFKIPCDLSKTEFTFVDTSGKITLSEKEFKSTALLASIKLGGANISDFSAKNAEYEFAFSSTENYPTLEVKTLNPLAKTEIALPEDNGGTAKITVTAEDGETEMDYEINFKYKESAEASAEVVNKDGKGGVITFVFDDGDLNSADIIISKLMKKYPSIRPSFAIITNLLANVKKQADSFDITPLEYKYYPIKNSIFSPTKYKYEFWKQAALVEGVDVLSHSHTHSNEGINADPVFELEASQAILNELCDADCLCYVLPGAGAITNDVYMSTIESGTIYIGARVTGSAPNFVDSYNPFKVASLAVTRHSTKANADGTYTTNENSSREECLAAGIDRWKNHIDTALEKDGWACFCMHGIVAAGLDTTGKWTIYEEQLDEVFKYAESLSKSGEAWVANFTEASIYYREWKESKITATVFGEDSVSVKLECPLDSEVFNMELTVKVAVPKSWTAASASGEELTVMENEDGTKYVYVNLAPGETISITK